MAKLNPLKTPAIHHRFLAESTLGRLAKWLRLAGLDTAYDTQTPDGYRLVGICRREGRTLLTRTRSIAHMAASHAYAVYISENAPVDQVRQVIHAVGLQPDSLRPLTRCASCNSLVRSLSESGLTGRVPEHILQNHTRFKACPQCHRVYWRGSHAERWLQIVDQWFDPKADSENSNLPCG